MTFSLSDPSFCYIIIIYYTVTSFFTVFSTKGNIHQTIQVNITHSIGVKYFAAYLAYISIIHNVTDKLALYYRFGLVSTEANQRSEHFLNSFYGKPQCFMKIDPTLIKLHCVM